MGIAAIIPAFNEERTLAQVVRAVQEAGVASELIVVDDGSTDSTAAVAKELGVTVISLPTNCGKAQAMKAGADHTSGEVLLYLDADLIGLRPAHVRALVEPVVKGQTEMTVGVFGGGRWRTDLAQRLTPDLSGQRAMRRWIMSRIENVEAMGYGVERALTALARTNGLQIRYIELIGVTQLTKEEKSGLWNGLRARFRMYRQPARLPR